MSWRIMASAVLLATATLSQPAAAQSPTLRGPWFGGGIGTASAQVNCELCTSDRNGGLSGYVAGGISLSPQVRAGLELAGWFDTTDEVSQWMLVYGGSLYWYPQTAAAWYLKGGVGLFNYHAGTPDEDDETLGASAAALQLGAGYDFRAGSRLWVTPYANMIVTTSGNLTSGNTIVTDASFSMLQLGAGLTWR